MNREELLVLIDKLPLFRVRDAGVKEDELDINGREVWHNKHLWKAVTEVDSTEPLIFVSNRYKVVQFKDMFKPLIEKIGDCQGRLTYYSGFGIMDIFPTEQAYGMENGRIGIVAYNSVDTTCALNIKFCVDYGGKVLTIPKKVANYRQIHVGDVSAKTQDYIEIITKIREEWETVISKFTKFQVIQDDLPSLEENFGLSEHVMKRMKKRLMDGEQFDLWKFCMEVISYLDERQYKSEVHHRKRLDKFIEAIFNYAFTMKL